MTHPRIHAAAHPDKLAVMMTDGSAGLTYGELEVRANQGAHLLRSLGVAQGDTIAYWLLSAARINVTEQICRGHMLP